MQAHVFADTVEHNHLVVDRVTNHGQDSTDEGLVDFERETYPAVADRVETYYYQCIECQRHN